MSNRALQQTTRDIMTRYFRAKTRDLMNSKITAMQISYDIIKAGFDFDIKKTFWGEDPSYFKDMKDKWTDDVLQKNYLQFINSLNAKPIKNLEEPPPDFMVKGKVVGTWKYVEGSGVNAKVLLIASNFKQLRSTLTDASKKVGRDQPLGFRERKTGNVTNYVSNIDIGHMASFGKEELNTVLSSKLGDTIKALNQSEFKDDPSIKYLSSALSGFIKNLSNIHLEYTTQYRKDTKLAEKLVSLKGNPVIGHFNFIMTVPQFWELNQKIINDKELETYFNAEEVLDSIIASQSSPPLIEMLWNLLLTAFQGSPKGAKYKTSISGSLDIPTGIDFKGATLKSIPPTILAPQLRSIDGKFFSTLRLQSLINAQLHDRLRANMGTGYSKDVLNYRTGRFAKSAKVTAINKVGTKLDTYFTYMKYPYSTFAPGGKQYKGDLRDPEKLIARSVREIAIGLISKQFIMRPMVGE